MKIKFLLFNCLLITNLNSINLNKLNLKQKRFLVELIKITLRSLYNTKNIYKNVPAQVRISKELNEQEQKFVEKRRLKVKENLEKIFNVILDTNKIPNISICCSGGGYRAMIATLGFLSGLQEIGLKDSITYASSLSGSTWALAAWISSNSSIDQIKEYISQNISNNSRLGTIGFPSTPSENQIRKLIKNITTEYLFNQPLESIDIWGALVTNNILKHQENCLELKLSEQQQIIENGNFMFPLYSAIEFINNNYEWYEFTPYEVGNLKNHSYIPTWAFGRSFDNGKSNALSTLNSKEYGPELSLAYLLGVFGSAFTVDIEEIVSMLYTANLNYIEKMAVDVFLKNLPDFIDQQRFFPAKTFNFNYNNNLASNKKQQYLTLIDAGINFNLPVPPLLNKQRKTNIIIILDATIEFGKTFELQKVEQYVKENNLKWPDINYNNLDKNSLSIFKSNDKDTPIVIYMPLVKDKNSNSFDPVECGKSGFCNTFNFAYSKDEFKQLFEFTKNNVVNNKDRIFNVIKDFILN